MVFGAITGVGIWFTIALIHPDATSVLIHSFVFGWAMEWVLFLVEIVAAFLYFYTFEKISKKTHILIGWIYFIAAWGSLVIINSILSFMLTPGKWLSTGNFWDGILNPSFIPSTLFRTFLSFALAGSYALLTASKKFKEDERETLTKYNGKWILISLAGMIPSLLWYYFTLPEQAKSGIFGTSYIMNLSAYHLYISLGLFILLSLFFITWKVGKLSFPVSLITLLSVFIFFGAFEFIRESGRKPYIISNYMYSNGIKVKDSKFPKDFPVLSISKWTLNKSVNENSMEDAGKEIFRIQCFACHSFGIKNNIIPKISAWCIDNIISTFASLRGITIFKPDFHGDDMDK
jgi:cytochrome bd-type quinol oxidase subunit 1